jgi:predicted Zn-dependent peptidase
MIKKDKLKNGLKYILVPNKNTQAVTVLVLIGVGSRHEESKIGGMAHFLEHMTFKGTVKRPNTLAIAKELDSLGADFNAYTSVDHTGFWVKINSEYLEKALDILSDIIFNSKLKAEELNKERGTILEEMNMYEDDPKRNSLNVLYDILFDGNSLGKDEIGTKKSLANINVQKMKSFKGEFYVPNNMVVGVAGNISDQGTDDLIEKYFNSRKKTKSVKKFKKFVNKQKSPQVVIKKKPTEQAHLAIGFHGYSYSDKDLEALKVFSTLFGGAMSSRLFINIRERHGLCYYIRSGLGVYEDTGSFIIQTGLDKNRLLPALKAIFKEIENVLKKGISKAELRKAQEIIKGNCILQLEDSSAVADWYTKQDLMGQKIRTPEEKIAQVEKVTVGDIERAVKKVFKKKNFNMAVIGDYEPGLKKEILDIIKF